MRKITHQMRPGMPSEARDRALKRIVDPSRPTIAFYLMVILSATIASFGLLANSTAVVIGAMLVAPLMSPIFGIALALSTGKRNLLKTALFAETVGIILVIGLSVLIGLIPLRLDFGTEILSRTQPTIYDIIIALASGLAGAYTLINEKINPALPGVAIATALVPPLATCGLNIAASNWLLARGAFGLFLVNFIAIEFAAALVFVVSGLVKFPSKGSIHSIRMIIHRLGISLVVLVLATIFMTQSLINIVEQRKLDANIRTVLSNQLSNYAGARLSDVILSNNNDGKQVIAVVMTPQKFDPSRILSIESVLQEEINPNIHLIVRSMITNDADSNGPVFVSTEELNLLYKRIEETNFMNVVSSVLSKQINSIDGAQLIDLTKDIKDGITVITANVTTPKAITPAEVRRIEENLHREVDINLKLVVRSVLTTDADATHFINNPTKVIKVLEGEDLELYNNLLNQIKLYLSEKFAGATLTELTFQKSEELINVYLTLETPFTFNPEIVGELQTYLQTYINPLIKLTVRSVVGGTASADSYIESTIQKE